MKRTVLLVRHGKACSHEAFEKDIDRVLTERGVNDGYKVAKKILEQGIKPDLILTSPATRASHSAMIFARAMNTGTGIIRVIENMYFGSGQKILDKIAALPDEVKIVALFGHNPAISDLSERLTDGATDFLPTTGAAIINYNIENWKDIHKSNPTDFDFVTPKMLR